MRQAPIRVAVEHACLGVQRDSERDVPELRAGLLARRNRFHEERECLSKGSRSFPRTAEMTLSVDNPRERLQAVGRYKNDVLVLSGPKPSGFYGFPNNFLERELAVLATRRNWHTVVKLVSKFRDR